MPNIGPLELAIVFVIVLLIFGPKRLPGLGRQLGTGMREFKESITGKGDRELCAIRGNACVTAKFVSGALEAILVASSSALPSPLPASVTYCAKP